MGNQIGPKQLALRAQKEQAAADAERANKANRKPSRTIGVPSGSKSVLAIGSRPANKPTSTRGRKRSSKG